MGTLIYLIRQGIENVWKNKIMFIDDTYNASLDSIKASLEILRKEKNGRGYIDFDLDEAKIVQDETGKAIDVVKRFIPHLRGAVP